MNARFEHTSLSSPVHGPLRLHHQALRGEEPHQLLPGEGGELLRALGHRALKVVEDEVLRVALQVVRAGPQGVEVQGQAVPTVYQAPHVPGAGALEGGNLQVPGQGEQVLGVARRQVHVLEVNVVDDLRKKKTITVSRVLKDSTFNISNLCHQSGIYQLLELDLLLVLLAEGGEHGAEEHGVLGQDVPLKINI